ncbi:MAG TPA: exo-alpha-sialidase [Streptosporangiaceae bacterium]|nr:exo-alpha-sialidase [Streptosporangiaceae bacterium]
MSQVRILVGTRKGAFVLTSDSARGRWAISDPHFPGWEVFHITGSRADPDRLYASQSTQWFGQLIRRSDDGGRTWRAMSNKFVYDGEVGTHRWHWGDGTPHRWEFERIWHLEPSPADPDLVYAGAADAALFRSTDGGQHWAELAALRQHESASSWEPGAGGLCLHTIVLPPDDPDRIFAGISAAGLFKSDDSGATWRPVNKGLRSQDLPNPYAEVGHCVHHVAMHPARPEVLFMQKHWDVMRSDDAGESWHEITGNLPAGFGFPIQVHAHEPDTVYLVPIAGESEHFPPGGQLRVYRSRTGGGEWEPLVNGLPQRDCYVNVLRDAMTADSLEPCGIYFGTTGGQVYASADEGGNWTAIARDLPAVLSVDAQVLP